MPASNRPDKTEIAPSLFSKQESGPPKLMSSTSHSEDQDQYETYKSPITDSTLKVNESTYKKFVHEKLGVDREMAEFSKRFHDFFAVAKSVPINPVSHFEDLLKDNFMVGEAHSAISSKNFLITNMLRLKAAGFDTFFVEHIFYDYQHELDYYHAHPAEQLQGVHAERLREESAGQRITSNASKERWDANTLTSVVEAALAAGIRVVALDTVGSYFEAERHRGNNDNFRISSFNYIASQIIEKEHKGRWFALVGNAHLKNFQGIPGIAELTGARSVYICDNNDVKDVKVELNTKASLQSNELLPAEVVIYNNPAYDIPSLSPTHLSNEIGFFRSAQIAPTKLPEVPAPKKNI